MSENFIGSPTALTHLSMDKRMAAAIQRLDPIAPRHNALSHFASLCRWIIGQQLSGSAASTIFERFRALASDGRIISPEAVQKISISDLRGIGVSNSKAAFIHELSRQFCDGILSESKIIEGSDDDIRSRLVSLKGIGNWTADMFLMFKLRRPDIFPMEDAGIRRGFRILYGLKTAPTDSQLTRRSKKWAPHRTTASLYLWKIADAKDLSFLD